MARTIPTPPKPATVIARRRNGAARRVEISAQEVEEAYLLLKSVPSPEARQLRDKFAAILRPVCHWASARTGRHSNYPAWGPCGVYVSAPNERCVEHQWPLPAGVQDPFSNRCSVTLDEELEDSRWVQYSGGLRCPFERRQGSGQCRHHDPRASELCGHPVVDGSVCTVPQGVFACRSHRYVRSASFKAQLEQLPLTLTCGFCDAPSGEPCTNNAGRDVAFHKKRVSASEESEKHQELSDEVEWLSL
ncbi:zinc finger domain-containing protein [Streptomyces sp. NPDC055817]